MEYQAADMLVGTCHCATTHVVLLCNTAVQAHVLRKYSTPVTTNAGSSVTNRLGYCKEEHIIMPQKDYDKPSHPEAYTRAAPKPPRTYSIATYSKLCKKDRLWHMSKVGRGHASMGRSCVKLIQLTVHMPTTPLHITK